MRGFEASSLIFCSVRKFLLSTCGLCQSSKGGGAKSINFQELAADLAQITFDYPFRIPPYFALIIRAIGVLEGIALVATPDFALVDEAYPYISKRLMTDNSPRLRESLRYMVSKHDLEQAPYLCSKLCMFVMQGMPSCRT